MLLAVWRVAGMEGGNEGSRLFVLMPSEWRLGQVWLLKFGSGSVSLP